MKFIKWFWAITLLATVNVANAAFVGENVGGYGNGFVVTDTPGQFTLFSSNLDDDQDVGSSYVYSNVAVSDIKVSFNWFYQTFDEDGSFDDGSWTDPAGYFVNGVKVQLNQFTLSELGSESGFSFFNVAAGSTYGFYADTDDNQFGGSALTISNFSITPVPEPESAALMLVGLVLIGRFSQKRTFSL